MSLFDEDNWDYRVKLLVGSLRNSNFKIDYLVIQGENIKIRIVVPIKPSWTREEVENEKNNTLNKLQHMFQDYEVTRIGHELKFKF